jgi:hypothetical protein
MKNGNLEKLIDFIIELSQFKENSWFKEKLSRKLLSNNSARLSSPQLDEIYEHCINKIICEHAQRFYSDFKLSSVKEKLIQDFIRMERFRRDDNFEDFCLAVFQQIEGIINELSTKEIHEKFLNSLHTQTHKIKNKSTGNYEDQKLWQLILYPRLSNEDLLKKTSKPLSEWDFLERYKLILYFFYYNQKLYNYQDFQMKYFLGNELYQSRNLNHRGGTPNEKQKITIEKVKTNSHKYYFKFLGFLEELTTIINSNI